VLKCKKNKQNGRIYAGHVLYCVQFYYKTSQFKIKKVKTSAILMSPPMVIATNANIKTVTRRLNNLDEINEDPDNWKFKGMYHRDLSLKKLRVYSALFENKSGFIHNIPCPYGEPGDVLWVRETFYAYGRWVKDGLTKTGKQKYKFCDYTLMPNTGKKYHYEDDKPQNVLTGRKNKVGYYKRPSLFMPKAACRIFLKITNVHAQRLHSITHADAKAEGVESCIASKEKFGCRAEGMRLFRDYDRQNNSLKDYPCNGFDNAKTSFETLWIKINGQTR